MPIFRWLKPSHIVSGFIAVLVGYTSSVAIVFQAATAAGASASELNSWMWALGIGMGASCIGLSVAYRQPVLTAWSTPGAALLATSLTGLTMGQAIGVFLFTSLLITLSGITGGFRKIMDWVPEHLAAAMLAGILTGFGMGIFIAIQTQWLLTAVMIVTYFTARLLIPRYSVPITLLAGIAWAAWHGLLAMGTLDWSPARPQFMMPDFNIKSLLGVGLPLFIVTMTSQNVPGLAVFRANGYDTPASPLISWTGITGVLLAPFGGYAFNLAAITAAICMSEDADPDPGERWRASTWAGVFYLMTGIFGATVVSIFGAFPIELIATIAGLALLGTIGNSLNSALSNTKGRDAALVTFLATASGMSFFGIGSAFWGLVFGMAIHASTQWHARRRNARMVVP